MTHASRAHAFHEADYLNAAIDEALLALRDEPLDAMAAADLRVLIGNAMTMKFQPLDALPYLDRVLTEFPDHAKALSARGHANWSVDRFVAARSDLERAISLNADDKTALEYLVLTYRDLGEREAIDPMIDRLLALDACPPYLLRERGAPLAEAGDPRGVADLRSAARLDDAYAARLLVEHGGELATGEELAAYALDRAKSEPRRAT